MVLAIEASHPFYFLQDDNRVQHLPFYVHNLRALIGGEFPFYNFHQYLGTPVTIQYAALYPINYIALCLSKLFLGNYFGTMEFIAVFHLIVAALGFYCLLRFFELKEVSCLFGAVAWTFCGFVITVGNSWIQTVGYAAFLPWILLFSIKQIYRFEVKSFLVLLVLKVCGVLLGNPQLFVYTMTFEFLTVIMLFFANKKNSADSINYAAARVDTLPSPTLIRFLSSFFTNYVFVFIITLPLILQTVQQTGISAGRRHILSWEEYAACSYKLTYWLNGLLVPFKAVDITTQFELHFISHIGYLTLIFLLLTVMSLKNRTDRNQILVFCMLAVFSLLWAGDVIVTKILYHIPLYNRLRFPFKVAFFTSFYLVIISAYGFDTFYNKLRSVKNISRTVVAIAVSLILIFHVSNFLILHAALPQSMFSKHLDAVPFDEPLQDKISAGRIVSAGLDDVWDGEKIVPGFSAPLLGFDYATLWGLFQFGGYDTMVSEKALMVTLGMKNNPVFNLPANEPFRIPSDTLEHFRKWGVRWYVADKAIPLGANTVFKLIYSDQHRNVLADPRAKPMVYWQENRTDSGTVHYNFTSNAVEVDCTSKTGGTVIINVLHHPFFSAQIDGKPLPITETADNQISVYAPEGGHRIVLKYADKNFIYGSLLSVAFMLLLIPCFLSNRVKAQMTTLFC